MDNYNIDSKQIIQLLIKEISEGLSVHEVEQLNDWINASPENKALYEKLYSEEYKKQRRDTINQFDAKEAWTSVLKEIEPKQRRILPPQFWQYAGVAASIILLVGLFLVFNMPTSEQPSVTAYENIKPGTNQAILTLADGKQIELNKLDTTINVSGGGINISASKVLYTADSKTANQPLVYHTLQTPRGGEYNLTLADGTKVWLNADSKLRYPESFTADNRTVYMEGEAYFEVAKYKNKPFFVRSGINTVKVLGTEFNVRSYPEDADTRITLCEGSIQLNTKNAQNILTPDQQAIINATSQEVVIQQVDSKLYTAWKDGMFMFRKAKLDKVMNDLSRWYNANLFYTNMDIKNTEFSLYMNRQENIKDVLEMLEATEEVSFNIEGNNIIISPS
ncbi:FecR family protein [Saccharicrinis sp. 156]|uniref:FecR family protein n=1 Tax=Saccharicrinis sp. 156 TaxID=3417574 RepID=UPI003D34EBBE